MTLLETTSELAVRRAGLRDMAEQAVEAHGLAGAGLRLLEEKKNVTWRVDAPGGERYLLRLCRPDGYTPEEIASEAAWLQALRRQEGLVVPEPVAAGDGSCVVRCEADGLEPRSSILFRWVEGETLDASISPAMMERVGEVVARMHAFDGRFVPPSGFRRPLHDCDRMFGGSEVLPPGCGEELVPRSGRGLLDEAARRVRAEIEALGTGPEVFGMIHTDPEPDNMVCRDGEVYPIDFADCGWGHYLYGIAASLLPLGQKRDFPALRAAFLRGYRRRRELRPEHEALLDTFLIARGLFAVRWMLVHGWETPKVRAYAAQVVPHILGEVRRYLQTGLSTVQLLSRLRARGVQLAPEGDRLRLRAPKGALTPELQAELAGRKAEVLAFLRRGAVVSEVPPIPRVARVPGRGLPLSFSQSQLWFLDQFDPGSPAYNIPQSVHLEGDVRLDLLDESLNEVVRRHEVLRTTFGLAEGQPVQIVAPSLTLWMPVVDLGGIPSAARKAEVVRLSREEARRPFDLTTGPLLRLTALRLAPAEHRILVTTHHIVSDGWSGGVFVRELATIYAALAQGRPSPLPELPIQFGDYATWQRGWLQGEVLERQLAYWRQKLAGAPAVLDLPSDRPRTRYQTRRGGRLDLLLLPELSQRLRGLAQRSGATLFMTLLAGFDALVFRYTGREDVVVGSPIANRNRTETEGLIGFFVNTLVLRTTFDGGEGFRELLAKVKETTVEAFAHQDLTFEKLVEELRPERSLTYTPLFQVIFNFQNTPLSSLRLEGLTLTWLSAPTGTEKFDLNITAREAPEGIHLVLRYKRDLFDPPTIGRLAGHFRALLETVTADPERPLAELPYLGEAERALLLHEWNDASAPVEEGAFHERFARQAARTPGAPAVVFAGQVLSYGELDRRANQLAHSLRRLGAGRGSFVGICLERSVDMAIAVFGVLKAGAAYVPLDPEYPAERLAFLIRDAGVRMLVTQSRWMEVLPSGGLAAVRLDAVNLEAEEASDPVIAVGADDLAYVIYTSGTTGEPKGAMIRHGAMANYASALRAAVYGGRRSPLRVSLNARITFDASVKQLSHLLWGDCLEIVPDAVRLDAEALVAFARERLDVLDCSPSQLKLLLRSGLPLDGTRPSVVLVGGEAIDETTWRELVACPGTRFYNHYGPTECTVNVTICRVSGDRPRLGRPVANVSVYLLDPGQQLVPVGVAGEICIGGAGLGQGYLGRPRQTAEKFIPDPFGGELGARLYRSGDLARLLPTGEIEFLGRIDHQVKLRGFRIELGEIEAVLRAHPAVREAVVLLRDDSDDPGAALPGERRLVAYVVAPPEEEPPAVPELRALLRSKLPDYMMPAAFVVLERLPLTANGKVDRRALPAPVRDHAGSVAAWSTHHTPTEERLAGLWAEVLGLVQVGREDHFFDLGGHSLLAARVTARIREAFGIELPLRELFENPTVAGLALAVDRERCRASAPPPPLVPVSREGELPLSYGQQRLWFLDQLESGSTAYHIPGALRLQGRLDPGLLRRVLAEIVGRHEVLRTVFPAVTGRPVQTILPELALPLPIVDLGALPEQMRGTAARRLAEEEALRPFDLSSGPLIRGMLLRVASEDHVALLTLHHIVADGWSMGVLFQELAALYQAFSRGAASPLPELPLQYADFAAWQRRWLAGETLEAEVGWWRRQLDGAPPSLDLPTDRPRPPVQTFRGRALPVALPMDVSAAVASLARSQRATPFMVLLAAFQVLLGRCSGQNDVVVGAPVAGRVHRDVEELIGFFVNMLALRGKLDWGCSFLDHLGGVRGTAVEAYLHQALPFEHLVEALRPERDLSRNPVFQVAFALQNLPRTDLELPGLRIARVRRESTTAKFDLGLTLQETPEGLSGWLEYSTDLFDLRTAERLAGCFRNLLEAIAADPDERLGDLPLMGPGELQQILGEWSGSACRRPLPDVGLHELFETRVRKEPAAVAVVFGDSSLTYQDLDARAEALAGRLRALGVGPETLVGICAEEGMERVVGVLGVFKAGGGYLPLDPANPGERLSFMIEDSGVTVLLVQERLLGLLPGSRAEVLFFEDLPAAPSGQVRQKRGLGGEALAYVIYTSGSTGRPNGVVVRHRSAVGLILEAIDQFQVGPGSRVLQSVSFSFDASVLETWLALASGAALCIAGREARISGEALAEQIRSQGITAAVLTPAVLAALPPGEVPPLQVVSVGGDRCPGELASHWAPPASSLRMLLNCYGPTETTIYTTFHLCAGIYRKEPPIGRPVPGSRAYVLDPRGRPLPEGVPGELFIAGEGLARGYLNRPARTAERFVPDPFSPEPGSRLYRTGDQVRWLPDGSLEFLGRVDLQVKIRGLRIELGEIEAVLGQHPAVRECAVAVHPRQGDPRLAAYVVPAAAGGLSPELRRHLRERLPDYMVPSDLVFLESLPLTPTGKVDRRALPAPGAGVVGESQAPARDELELEIARIWEDLLGRPMGIRDDFFDVGGHSLLAVQLLARIRARLGHRIPLSELFRGTTVERMAALLRDQGAQLRRSTLVELQPGDGEAALFLVHPVGGTVFCYLELARHLGGPVYGLQASAGGESLEAMAARYVESVRGVQPAGPYFLAGWSLGGAVAFEMARQLAERGERVNLLALIDPSVPASGEPGLEPDEEALARLFARDLEGLQGLETQELFDVFRHNVRALRAWRPRPYSGTAVLFRAAERLPGETADPVARWSDLVTGGLEVEAAEGHHYSILRGPRARSLAERLRGRLGRAGS